MVAVSFIISPLIIILFLVCILEYENLGSKGKIILPLIVSLAFTFMLVTFFAEKKYSTTEVKSFTKDDINYIHYNKKMINLNKEFERTFKDDTTIIVKQYSPIWGLDDSYSVKE